VKLDRSLLFPAIFVTAISCIYMIDVTYQLSLYKYGLYPRELKHLYGILTIPFLHGSWSHVSNNAISIFVLLFLLSKFYDKLFYPILISLTLISWIWTAARPSFHIGASALIYGLAAFLILSGFIRKNSNLLRISLLTIFVNGGIVWGMLPYVKASISWEGHLFGALSGVLIALYYRNQGPENDQYSWDLYPEDEDEFPYWLENSEVKKPNIESNTNSTLPNQKINYSISNKSEV